MLAMDLSQAGLTQRALGHSAFHTELYKTSHSQFNITTKKLDLQFKDLFLKNSSLRSENCRFEPYYKLHISPITNGERFGS